MLEIAFTESAAGGLKLAQSFGKGKYHSGAIGVFIHHEDGSDPTQEEIEAAQHQAEERQRREWERAIPLGGNSGDVYCLSLGLSFGDIQNPLCAEDRLEALKVMYSFWDNEIEQQLRSQIVEMSSQLELLRSRIAAGEDARIWYSDSMPDELCGFYWLMDELRNLPKEHGTIYALKLPNYDEIGDEVISYTGWGEIAPGQFGRFTHLALPVSDQMRRIYGNIWKKIQEENGVLRACINGKLQTAPENLYDHLIQTELSKMPDTFKEAILVGNVLGRHAPGISDGYIHLRVEKMVREGRLTAVTQAREGEPGYWRMIKKNS